MRLIRLAITNYRSIKKIEDLRIEPVQTFVGENNAGKSNILRAINLFLSAGYAGMDSSDFNDPAQPVLIEAQFGGLSATERKQLRPYLIGDRVILQKKLTLVKAEKTAKTKIEFEHHGYKANPKAWFLSMDKAEEQKGAKSWKEVAEENGILEYAQMGDGKVNKSSYAKGIEKYLLEHDNVEYDEPQLGHTQALGIPQNLLTALPEFYLLPAITDYSDEIDRRSSSSVFPRLLEAREPQLRLALPIIRPVRSP